jgi:hypothetical protein
VIHTDPHHEDEELKMEEQKMEELGETADQSFISSRGFTQWANLILSIHHTTYCYDTPTHS